MFSLGDNHLTFSSRILFVHCLELSVNTLQGPTINYVPISGSGESPLENVTVPC